MRQGRNFPAVAGLNGQLFAMGGRAPDSTVGRLSSVEVYHVETNQWRPAKPLVINSMLLLPSSYCPLCSEAATVRCGRSSSVVGGFDN